MGTAIYARVSTDEQSLEPQFLELRAIAVQRGMTITHELSDVISGSKSSRVGLDELMRLVRAKQIDAVLVAKLDRVARSLTHFAQIIGELDKHGVALVCPGQSIDTTHSNPASRFQIHILAAVAQLERDFIRERTRAGLAAAKARGAKIGHPSTRLVANHAEVLAQWKSEGGRHLRDLASRLGGVSVSFAHTLSKRAA